MKLPPRLAAFAAAYLDALHSKSKNPTPPIQHAAPDFFDQRRVQIMRNNRAPLHCRTALIAHFPTSQERIDALNIIRWTLAVAGIYADSPRFAYYVSRWDVPGKVARAITNGTFDDTVANCRRLTRHGFDLYPAPLKHTGNSSQPLPSQSPNGANHRAKPPALPN